MVEFNWAQVGVTVLGTIIGSVVPVTLYMQKNRREAKKDISARHEQNLDQQKDMANLLRYHPPHTHTERSGPLSAEGISRPPEDR